MCVDWEAIRSEEFPATSEGVQLRAAAGSPLSRSAYEAARGFLEGMHRKGDVFWEEALGRVEEVRGKVAEYLNSGEGEVGFLANTSSCMTVIPPYLDPGVVLYPAYEFPSSVHSVQRAGFTLRPIPPVGGGFPVEAIEEAVEEGVSTLITSHVQYLTGFRQNLEETGRLCRRRGLRQVVNATQSFGAFPIDVEGWGIDLLAASGLKWACAGYGVAVLYIGESLLSGRRPPPLTGWLSVENPMKMDPLNVSVRKRAGAFDALGGAPPFPQIYALGGALSLVERVGDGSLREGISRISSRILSLSDYLSEGLETLGVGVVTPLEREHRSGITTIETPRAEKITLLLEEKGILVTCRRNPLTGEKSFLRISLHFYNNHEDVDALIEELGRMRVGGS